MKTKKVYDVILDTLTLANHYVVFKFTPFENDLKKSSFTVASESLAKVTPGNVANMAMSSIKVLSFYGFPVYIVVADGVTENVSFFEGMISKSISLYIPSDLKNEFKYINYNFKNVMIHPITVKGVCRYILP